MLVTGPLHLGEVIDHGRVPEQTGVNSLVSEPRCEQNLGGLCGLLECSGALHAYWAAGATLGPPPARPLSAVALASLQGGHVARGKRLRVRPRLMAAPPQAVPNLCFSCSFRYPPAAPTESGYPCARYISVQWFTIDGFTVSCWNFQNKRQSTLKELTAQQG